MVRPHPLRLLYVIGIIGYFSILSTEAVEPHEACKKTLSTLVQREGFFRKNLRLFKFDVAGTTRSIDDFTGSLPSSNEIPFLPYTAEETKEQLEYSMKTVQSWIERYKSYSDDLRLLNGSIGRYVGEDPSLAEGYKPPQTEADKRVDQLRREGRIAIFEKALGRVSEASEDILGYNSTSRIRRIMHGLNLRATDVFYEERQSEVEAQLPQNAKFPMTLEFPRSPKRVGARVQLQQPANLTVQKTFKDVAELQAFLKKDRSELKRDIRLIELRILEQAELLSRLWQLRENFPKGSAARLREMLKAEEERRKELATQGEVLVDPKTDPNYHMSYALRDAVNEVTRLLYSRAPDVEALRPPVEVFNFINGLTRTNVQKGFVRASSWVDSLRRYTHWFTRGSSVINTWARKIKGPAGTWASVIIIVGAIETTLHFTREKVTQVHDYIAYDEAEMKARSYFEDMRALRLSISVPATSYKDFYERFRAYGQDKFSDEAVTIAFEYFNGIRAEPKASTERDVGILVGRLEGYSKEAAEIVKRHDILLKGFKTPYGSISGVMNRLGRRQYNVWLTERIYTEKNDEIKQNLQKFLNPVIEAPVVEMGPPAPEELKSSGDVPLPSQPPAGTTAEPVVQPKNP